jgi:Polyketide cyclase / dehydrase and lipid transport
VTVEVDVVTEIEIERPRAEVSAYASDPDNATEWYRNITRVEWETAKPLAVGSRLAFVAQFLGRTLAYTYEVIEMTPGERFVMATSEGPFAMETTYMWSDVATGGTKMTLRNRGRPSGFGRVAAPVMRNAMRRANAKDLARLKEILESDSRAAG